jgi:Fe-S cluster biogenesis protein NfuA
MSVVEELKPRIEKALDSIRPYLKNDGGNIELIEISDEMIVKVKLTGACDGCPFSMLTLKAGVESAICKEVPDIKQVIAVE